MAFGVSVGSRAGDRIVGHTHGEAVGFLSDSFVMPEASASRVVALINADFRAAAHDAISGGDHRSLPSRGLAPASLSLDETRDLRPRRVFDHSTPARAGPRQAHLRARQIIISPSQATEDYHTSLAPLGDPASFTARGKPRLRGGHRQPQLRHRLCRWPQADRDHLCRAGQGREFEQFLIQPRG